MHAAEVRVINSYFRGEREALPANVNINHLNTFFGKWLNTPCDEELKVKIVEKFRKAISRHCTSLGIPLFHLNKRKIGYLYPGLDPLIRAKVVLDSIFKGFAKEEAPLKFACRFGYLQMVRQLVQLGANVNIVYASNTPLHEACSLHSEKDRVIAARIALYLLASGAHPVRNQEGQRPQDLISPDDLKSCFRDYGNGFSNVLETIPFPVRLMIYRLLSAEDLLIRLALVSKSVRLLVKEDLIKQVNFQSDR